MIDWSLIEAWPLAEVVRRSVWAYPVLESVHIAAFAALVGSLLLLELRVFGVQRALPLPAFARLAVRTSLAAFALAAASGGLLFISAATRTRRQPGLPSQTGIDTDGRRERARVSCAGIRCDGRIGLARWQAGASLLIWLAVIGAGRMIAYI